MGIGDFFENLLVVKILGEVFDFIDDWDFALLRGLGYIAMIVLIGWFLLYFLLWQGYYGHLNRTLWILGIWIFIEFAYLVGSRDERHGFL